MIRELSYSEISTALDCSFRHAFRYTGHLTDGAALKPKTLAPALRDGRAWGRGLATYYAEFDRTDGLVLGLNALDDSLREDADEQEAAGLFFPEDFDAARERLHAMLEHQASVIDPLPVRQLEHELLVALPSRAGRRRSNRYRLRAYFDGIHVDQDGRTWIWEAKLRRQLRSYELVVLSPQLRFYAWAFEQSTGTPVTGVIVDERLNDVPKSVAFNKDGKPSKRQNCTPRDYEVACLERDLSPDDDVLLSLREKRWQQRHTIIFRPGELDEAGLQLVSAAQLIHQLDVGQLYPIRNPSRVRCPGCAFRDICQQPDDADLVDALFDRVPAKRNRTPEEVPAA